MMAVLTHDNVKSAPDVVKQDYPEAVRNGVDHGHDHDHNHDHDHDHDHDHERIPEDGSDDTSAAMYQISIKLPQEPYKINVMISTQEQVQDLRSSIVETPETFQYTCFHLEHNGERINDFIELSEVKDLKAGSVVTLVEDPYTEKEARMHIVRIKELIGASGDRSDQLHGICAGASLHDELFGSGLSSDNAKEHTGSEKIASLAGYDAKSPAQISCILPKTESDLPRTIKSLSISQWNPPPYHLRQRGHLLYLLLTTNEGEQHQITCTISGFYVNKSSSNKFDPMPRSAPKNYNAHSLLTLISALSPAFNTAFVEVQKINGQKDLLTTFPFQNAIPANPWLIPVSATTQHQADPTRSQESYLLGGADGAENLRDWNEEFQTTRELPRESLQDRVFRERLTSKLFADYNEAAARGAVMVARGEVAPLNPTEGRDAQIFIYNNIFYSFGADGVQTFASEGGDEAARVAVGKDVVGVRAVNQLDIPGLFTPGTVVVDYLGKRIVGQSIVPGIFKQREAGEHQIDYGGVEGRDIVTENEAFVPVFEKLSKALRVKKHAVWDKEGNRHDLEGSVETKGLLGTDGRKYVLDLYRVAPLDVAWADEVADPDSSDESYPHRMSVLRLELVEIYWRIRMQEYVKAEIDKKRLNQPADSAPESKQVTNGASNESKENGADESEQMVEKAISDNDRVDISNFNLALNPDVCTGQIPQTEEEKAEYVKDEKEVRNVCDFLRSRVIPDLIRDLYESDVGFPMDGASLCQLLHKRGINIRYLGRLATLAAEKGKRVEAFYVVAVQEMIARAFKHILNGYLRHLPAIFAPACISHLLNCLLTSAVNPDPQADIDGTRSFFPDGNFSFEKVSPGDLKSEIEKQVKIRFRFGLPEDWFNTIKHLQILREICLKHGIQIVAKDYSFVKEVTVESPVLNGSEDEGKKKKKKATSQQSGTPPTKTATTFVPEDILNIIPVVKDAAPRSALAEEALEAGKISLAQGQRQLGQELVLESLSLHEQIYGILHPEVAKMYHALSTIYYQIDEKEAAVELARKAVVVTERTLGLDSHDTILAYLNLSLFEHHVGNTKRALQYVRHALDVWKVLFGPNHPDSITTMNNVAVMFQALKEYSESRRWFENCFAVCEDFYGRQTINAATILFQLAQALALDGDAKGAVKKMKDAYNIFRAELGPEDRNTKEAETWLEQLTQNAVNIAKQAQYLEKRGLRYMSLPRLNKGTQLQPQNASSAVPNSTTTNGAIASASAASGHSGTGSVSLDSRSIDELMKYIEGDSTTSTSKNKRKSVNPRARGGKRV